MSADFWVGVVCGWATLIFLVMTFIQVKVRSDDGI